MVGEPRGSPAGTFVPLEAVKLFDGLTWISPKILAVKGDADLNFVKVLNIMDQALTLQESWRRLPKPGKPTDYHTSSKIQSYLR